MTWLSFDDDYTNQAVWDTLPYDTRWHYHAIVQTCCKTRRYDGRLPWTVALRCSDVPDPERSMKELASAGLLADHGADVEAVFIDDFLPPAHLRPEQLAPRKRRNQAEYRRRKCKRGQHDQHCPADCPVRVTGNPDGNQRGDPGSGRDGTTSLRPDPKSGTQNPGHLGASEAGGREAEGRDESSAQHQDQDQDQDQDHPGSSRRAGAASVPAGGQPNPSPFPTPGNGNGPEQLPPGERNLMNGVQVQSSATAPIAREFANGGPVRASTIARRNALKQHVAAQVGASPGCTVHDLQSSIGGNRDNLLTAVRQLAADGVITVSKDPADGRVRRYALAGAS